jgi:hypothetical protein
MFSTLLIGNARLRVGEEEKEKEGRREREREREREPRVSKKWMLLDPKDHPSPEKLASIFPGKFHTQTKLERGKKERRQRRIGKMVQSLWIHQHLCVSI